MRRRQRASQSDDDEDETGRVAPESKPVDSASVSPAESEGEESPADDEESDLSEPEEPAYEEGAGPAEAAVEADNVELPVDDASDTEAPGAEDKPETAAEAARRKAREDPSFVPRDGRFFMHDDRGPKSRLAPYKRRDLYEPEDDEGMWLHDKFDELALAPDPPKTFADRPRRPSRGRGGRGRGGFAGVRHDNGAADGVDPNAEGAAPSDGPDGAAAAPNNRPRVVRYSRLHDNQQQPPPPNGVAAAPVPGQKRYSSQRSSAPASDAAAGPADGAAGDGGQQQEGQLPFPSGQFQPYQRRPPYARQQQPQHAPQGQWQNPQQHQPGPRFQPRFQQPQQSPQGPASFRPSAAPFVPKSPSSLLPSAPQFEPQQPQPYMGQGPYGNGPMLPGQQPSPPPQVLQRPAAMMYAPPQNFGPSAPQQSAMGGYMNPYVPTFVPGVGQLGVPHMQHNGPFYPGGGGPALFEPPGGGGFDGSGGPGGVYDAALLAAMAAYDSVAAAGVYDGSGVYDPSEPMYDPSLGLSTYNPYAQKQSPQRFGLGQAPSPPGSPTWIKRSSHAIPIVKPAERTPDEQSASEGAPQLFAADPSALNGGGPM